MLQEFVSKLTVMLTIIPVICAGFKSHIMDHSKHKSTDHYISLTVSNGEAIGFDRFLLFFFYSILLNKSCPGHNSAPFWSWGFIFGHNVLQH